MGNMRLSIQFVSQLTPAKMTSPAGSLLVMKGEEDF
jgi:hypothetical protein